MPMPLPPGKTLAVPPMHPDLNPEIRAQVLDYVARRMIVEAINLAEDAEYERRRGHQPPTAYAHATYSVAERTNTPSSGGELATYDPDDLAEFADAIPVNSAAELRDRHLGKALMDKARQHVPTDRYASRRKTVSAA